MPFWLAAVLGFFIVARATRFVNSDVLGESIRHWAAGIEKPGRLRRLKRAARRPLRAVFGDELTTLVNCPWCLSIWFALPVAAVVVLGFGHFSPGPAALALVSLWLGYSYVYGLVALNLDD